MKTKILTKTDDGKNMVISVGLRATNYTYWSITADIYEKGKRMIEKNIYCSGCCHDKILLARPDLKIFVDLHLSYENGVPMYAFENGFYFYEIMCGVAKYHKKEDGDYEKYFNVLMNHLRISSDSLSELIRAMEGKRSEEAKMIFSAYCNSLIPYWKAQSEEAKQILKILLNE